MYLKSYFWLHLDYKRQFFYKFIKLMISGICIDLLQIIINLIIISTKVNYL